MLPRNEYRISITPYCNMKCVYCHNEGNIQNTVIHKEDIEKLIIDSRNMQLKSIRLTGGEPLIHPEIYEICQLIYEKYGLKVGINTNGIEIDKLMKLINLGYVDRVVVGLDYYDEKISKNSPIGQSSNTIRKNILKIKEAGCNVSIASVFCNDYENKMQIIDWGVKNKIRVKIIEEACRNSDLDKTKKFAEFRRKVIEKYQMKPRIDKFNEWNIYINGYKVITFFHSHCAAKKCDICQRIHIRITSNGDIKKCIFTNKKELNIRDIDFRKKILQYIR
jgi:cyclic pyranopterin phosphate synthase